MNTGFVFSSCFIVLYHIGNKVTKKQSCTDTNSAIRNIEDGKTGHKMKMNKIHNISTAENTVNHITDTARNNKTYRKEKKFTFKPFFYEHCYANYHNKKG